MEHLLLMRLPPERLQASLQHTALRDAARFAGLDSSLRLALNLGLVTEALDRTGRSTAAPMAC